MGRNRAEREMREGKRAEGRGGVRFVVLVLVPVLGDILREYVDTYSTFVDDVIVEDAKGLRYRRTDKGNTRNYIIKRERKV
ncbi:hypothetical protein D3Z51_04375 [Clostridiaceae bacterium]|nr:hypothetical protein [Clostridiaceae bacterium]RKI17517.1 hypothetical protein D7V81_03260 [bacterium 1XD21-70]